MAPKAVLIGLPGSGKSTIGRRLAKSLGVELLDTDAAIEQTTGRAIPDIFANDGELKPVSLLKTDGVVAGRVPSFTCSVSSATARAWMSIWTSWPAPPDR